jgi:signal transduction histidine kinase
VLGRFSIRWRLAIISSALTFLVLCAFAIVVGQLTTGKVRSSFDSETANSATELSGRLRIPILPTSPTQYRITPDINVYAASNDAAIRLFDATRRPIQATRAAPDFGPPVREGTSEVKGYLVETRQANAPIGANTSNPNSVRVPIWIEYARPLADVKSTIRGVRWFLAIGVFLGTLLAFLASLALAKRSLRPITDLTVAARDITRTQDPGQEVPQPRADDEVAELAQTLNEMLGALDASRSATETALERQRAFVADASHELRTPLTSVLANLELLADELDGEQRDAAASALRSSRRMRRLVADLLLLARSDAGSERVLAPVDVAAVAIDAVGEAGALSAGHRLAVDAAPGLVVNGARDELHRLVLNLVENAINHTPDGTRVTTTVRADDDLVVVAVEDDGPGVPPELRERIFERFVRSAGDRGGSTGLGLAIVRAVAHAHGGEVMLEDARPGARFVVQLPRLCEPAVDHADAAPAHVAQTRRAAIAHSLRSRRPMRRR